MTLRRGVANSLLLASAWAAAPGRRSLLIRRNAAKRYPATRSCVTSVFGRYQHDIDGMNDTVAGGDIDQCNVACIDHDLHVDHFDGRLSLKRSVKLGGDQRLTERGKGIIVSGRLDEIHERAGS